MDDRVKRALLKLFGAAGEDGETPRPTPVVERIEPLDDRAVVAEAERFLAILKTELAHLRQVSFSLVGLTWPQAVGSLAGALANLKFALDHEFYAGGSLARAGQILLATAATAIIAWAEMRIGAEFRDPGDAEGEQS